MRKMYQLLQLRKARQRFELHHVDYVSAYMELRRLLSSTTDIFGHHLRFPQVRTRAFGLSSPFFQAIDFTNQ